MASLNQATRGWVAGIDGCRTGWVAFKVVLPSLSSSVEIIDVVATLRRRPSSLLYLTIDIPIGLLDRSRACDRAAKKLLGRPRGSSVFATPCRSALSAVNHANASAINARATGRGLSRQAWGIASKIKQVDDEVTPEFQQWFFEVHPEVCFWALAGGHAMEYRKKTQAGVNERVDLLRNCFPSIEEHLKDRPIGVAKDDLLDAAAAAWTALRIHAGVAQSVCNPERDDKGLSLTIWY